MKRDPILTLRRALTLRCPACGRASIVKRPFNVKHGCDSCGVIFKREEGFFVGAIMANVVATEVFIVLIYLGIIAFTSISDRAMLGILFLIGVAFPLAFYHHSWSLWLAMDHLIEGLPREEPLKRR